MVTRPASDRRPRTYATFAGKALVCLYPAIAAFAATYRVVHAPCASGGLKHCDHPDMPPSVRCDWIRTVGRGLGGAESGHDQS